MSTYHLTSLCILLHGLFLSNNFVTCREDFDDEICKGPNEIYSFCGTACQPTCVNYMMNLPCDKPCVRGCFCKMGFVRNIKWKCVMPEHCHMDVEPTYDCGQPNEQFYVCGTECPDTCDNYMLEKKCARRCVPGCQCEPGYVRDSIGFCVLPKDCPPQGISLPANPTCKKQNETFSNCGSACPTTCANYNNPPKCKKKCTTGCFCIKGYVRDYDNKCILIKDCPAKAPLKLGQFPECTDTNEEYLTCGLGCERTCENHKLSILCSTKCTEGCFCKPGLVRNNKGVCIHPYYCPPEANVTCKYLEQPATPKRPCSGTCDDASTCIPDSLDKCVCQRGMVRDDMGQCVHPEYCPVACYQAHEVFDCASPCDRECETLGEPCPVFTDVCHYQCYCREGYARDRRGRCIQLKYCPRKMSVRELFYAPEKFILV